MLCSRGQLYCPFSWGRLFWREQGCLRLFLPSRAAVKEYRAEEDEEAARDGRHWRRKGRKGKLSEREGRRQIIITGERQEILPPHTKQIPSCQSLPPSPFEITRQHCRDLKATFLFGADRTDSCLEPILHIAPLWRPDPISCFSSWIKRSDNFQQAA